MRAFCFVLFWIPTWGIGSKSLRQAGHKVRSWLWSVGKQVSVSEKGMTVNGTFPIQGPGGEHSEHCDAGQAEGTGQQGQKREGPSHGEY